MSFMAQPAISFEVRDLGEVSDSISDNEFDSDTYETGPIEELYEPEVIEEVEVIDEPQANTEEDVW
jgi:hypothetical protein